MAQPGTYTAYRQLKPLEGDVSQDIQQQEENGFRRRALAQAEERTQNEQAERKARLEKENFNLIKSQTPVDTGSKSKNEAIAKALLLAQDQYTPVMNILNNKEKYSTQEYIDATLKLDALNNFVENTQAMDKFVTQRDLEYRKGVQEGNLFPNPEYEKNYQEGYQNKVLGVSERGKPVLYFIDKNNDGIDDVTGKKGKIGDYEDYSDMENGVGLDKYKFKKRYNYENVTDDLSKKIQSEINQKVKGGLIIKTTGVNPAELDDTVKSALYNNDGTPSEILESFATDFGIDLKNPIAVKSFEEGLKNKIRLRSKKGTEESVNNEARQWAEFEYKKSQDKKGEPQEYLSGNDFAEPGVAISKSGSNTSKSTIGGKIVEGLKGSKVYNLKGGNLSRKIGEEGANEIVQSVYVLPSGELALQGFRVDGETTITGKNDKKQKTSSKQSNTTEFFYRTKGNDAESDAVLDIISKKKNPDTNDYYKSIEEFKAVVTRGNANSGSSSNKITKGQKVDGYQFLGGDPNDPKSWKKI